MNIKDKNTLVTLWNQLVEEQCLVRLYADESYGIETRKLYFDDDNLVVLNTTEAENGE